VSKFGLWDQIRVDHGKEWYLMLYVNQTVAHLRNNPVKEPHVQTSSKKVHIISTMPQCIHVLTSLLYMACMKLQNHTIERIWVEVNSRVNYPIKAVLVDMLEKGEISTDDPVCRYCISWFIIQVANSGVSIFLSAWNEHPIAGED